MHEPSILNVVIEIVGGGLIGLSCGWELQQRGYDVVVYEMDLSRIKSSSWAGAGMLGAHAESFPDEAWRQRAFESAAMYGAWVERLGGTIDYHAGREGEDGHVDPRDLLRELTKRVAIVDRRVDSLGTLLGEQVVVCAGAWAGTLGGLPLVEPVKGYLLAWDGIAPGTLAGILRDGHTYILQRKNGRVIAGSTEQRIGFDRSMDQNWISELQSRAQSLWPLLKGREVAEVWFGFRPGSESPVVRRINERVVAAYGHYRNGILLAPWTARWVADEIQRQLGK